MAEQAKVVNNPELQKKIEEKIGHPVVAMLSIPMEPAEQTAVEKLQLKEGDLLSFTRAESALGAHSVSCSVSVNPFDCGVDVD